MPKLDKPDGVAYREAQLLQQLPKQDLSLKSTHHISQRDQSSYQDFICARNDIALDVGHAVVITKDLNPTNAKDETKEVSSSSISAGSCRKCQGNMNIGDLAVVAPRFALRDYWHPACFTCTVCDEILVDLCYCKFNYWTLFFPLLKIQSHHLDFDSRCSQWSNFLWASLRRKFEASLRSLWRIDFWRNLCKGMNVLCLHLYGKRLTFEK